RAANGRPRRRAQRPQARASGPPARSYPPIRWRVRPFTGLPPSSPVEWGGPPFSGLHTLTLHDPRAGGRRPAGPHAQSLTQEGRNPLPAAAEPPRPPGMVHGLTRREVMGQRPPSDPTPQPVTTSIDDLAQINTARPPARLGGGQQRGQDRPFA